MRRVVGLCVEASLPVPGDPPGKGHLGNWDTNQKSCSYCCKCFGLSCWSWGDSGASRSRLLPAGKHVGSVPRRCQGTLGTLP